MISDLLIHVFFFNDDNDIVVELDLLGKRVLRRGFFVSIISIIIERKQEEHLLISRGSWVEIKEKRKRNICYPSKKKWWKIDGGFLLVDQLVD